MTKDIIVLDAESSLVPAESVLLETYGQVLRQSTLCPVCISLRCKEVNLARARDLKSYAEITSEFGFSRDTLESHFRQHYDINTKQKKLLSLKENTDSEDLAIVGKVFDGEIDAFSALQDILKYKAKRLHGVNQRLNKIEEQFDIGNENVEDKQEYALLHKTANDIENSMQKIYKMLHEYMFPTNREALTNAVLQYKINILSQIVDGIQDVLNDMEKDPEAEIIIRIIRKRLSIKINKIEGDILKSGGNFNSE